MKKGITFSLIFALLIVSLSLVLAVENCTETDDGEDYEEKAH